MDYQLPVASSELPVDPLPVHGFVLAGGKSSRMGRDKALLELDGRPLIQHAVKKLRRVCVDVCVLGNDAQLAAYAPLVPDVHPDCGPMSAMEAGLLHSKFAWNLFLAVDMPFVPTALLLRMLGGVWSTNRGSFLRQGEQVRMLQVDGRAQPGFCMLHKDVAPFLTDALERGAYKLVPVLEHAARTLAERKGFAPEGGLFCLPLTAFSAPRGNVDLEDWCFTSEAQMAARELWFANLNTPADFVEAERHVDALDT